MIWARLEATTRTRVLINDAGQVAGFWSEDGPFDGPFHAVMWDHGTISNTGNHRR